MQYRAARTSRTVSPTGSPARPVACYTLLWVRCDIDGLPLFKSNNLQFWPILINVHDKPKIPVMVVSIYCGTTKPASIEHFLKPFVEDLNLLMKNGVEVDGRRVNFKIRAIIAHSPARAFIKGKKKTKYCLKHLSLNIN